MPTIFDRVWYGDTTLQLKYYEEVVCAPFGRWVGEYKFYGAKLSVFHCGAKLSVFTWRCQIVRFYMTVPNCPRCQIVRFTWRCQIVRVPNCPFLHCGAKLSVFHCGAKLSAVPNCPRCQIVLESHTDHLFLLWAGNMLIFVELYIGEPHTCPPQDYPFVGQSWGGSEYMGHQSCLPQ